MRIEDPTDMSSEENLTEEQEIYKENIIDHYKKPHNKRQIEDPSCIEKGINPLCGDHLELFLKVENQKVVDVSFEGDGCAISQASISMLTDFVLGKDLTELKNLTEDEIYDLLGIPISHTRRKCALLSLNTLQKAIQKYENDTDKQ